MDPIIEVIPTHETVSADRRSLDVMKERLDITDRRDVTCLVNVFYDRVRADDLLGPIFDDVARVDWTKHLPRM